jgi:hypothetical protein
MAPAVGNFHPLLIDNDDDETMMDASPARTISPKVKGMFTDSFALPAIHIKLPNYTGTFSWSDFPLLTEDVVYINPGWQPHKSVTCHEKQELYSSSKRIRLQENFNANDLFSSNRTRSFKLTTSIKPAVSKTSNAQVRTTNTTILRKRPSNNKNTRRICFDSVHIREHSVTLGDHDWCEGTLAVTLDWPHVATPKSMPITDYESMRQRQGRVPRGCLPKLEHWQRKQLLLRVGGMNEEVVENIESVEHDHHHHSYSGLPRTKTVPSLAATKLQHSL